MKTLPTSVGFYRRTPDFTEATLPAGLKKVHQTKANVWGRIVVLDGTLTYRILESESIAYQLDVGNPGIIEPAVKHFVEPIGKVRFYVEFYR